MKTCPVVTTYLRALRQTLEETPIFYSMELDELAEIEEQAANEAPTRLDQKACSFRAVLCLFYGLKDAGGWCRESESILVVGWQGPGTIKQLIDDLTSGVLEEKLSAIAEKLSVLIGEMCLMGVAEKGLDAQRFATMERNRASFEASQGLANAVRTMLQTKSETEAVTRAKEAAAFFWRICELNTMAVSARLKCAKELLEH
jgi:hypothetical protein